MSLVYECIPVIQVPRRLRREEFESEVREHTQEAPVLNRRKGCVDKVILENTL